MDKDNALFEYLESADASDVGRRRRRNEDSVARIHAQGVFCVADGMGGEDSGDVASQATVREVTEAMNGLTDPSVRASAEKKGQALDRALHDASEWIRKRAEDQGRGISGSTVVALAFDAFAPVRAVAVHAGDSRIYRLRKNALTQITRDHSMAEESGLSKKQLPKMFRGMVTRAVGISENLQLAHTDVDVREGDLFLLCSDGLTGMLSDRKIRRRLLKDERAPLDDLVVDLVADANHAGGEDNISVILVRVGAFPPPPATEEAEQAERETRTDVGLAASPSEKSAANEDSEKETADTAPLNPPAAPDGAEARNAGNETAETLRRPPQKLKNLTRLFLKIK